MRGARLRLPVQKRLAGEYWVFNFYIEFVADLGCIVAFLSCYLGKHTTSP